MSDIEKLIEEARSDAKVFLGLNVGTLLSHMADALAAEHKRAEEAEAVIANVEAALRADDRSSMRVVVAQEMITRYRLTTDHENGSDER